MRKQPKTLRLKFSKKDLRALIAKEPKGLRQKIDAAIKPELKILKQHFKKDGWDIDFNCVKSDIVARLIGLDLGWAVLYRLVNAGYSVESGKDGKMVIKRD